MLPYTRIRLNEDIKQKRENMKGNQATKNKIRELELQSARVATRLYGLLYKLEILVPKLDSWQMPKTKEEAVALRAWAATYSCKYFGDEMTRKFPHPRIARIREWGMVVP